MMMDFNWDIAPAVDSKRFNTAAYINDIPEDVLEAFRTRALQLEPLYGTYNYDALERAVADGVTAIDLMLMIVRVLKKFNNLEALQQEIKDRYAQIRNHQHPKAVVYYNLSISTIFTITNCMNVVISQFSENGAGRLFLGVANQYIEEMPGTGYADTSALLMQMNIPKTIRALDIISYPFLNTRVKSLTSDEYIRELKQVAKGLPLEERHIPLLAAEHVMFFIATSTWYMGKASYGLRNNIVPSGSTSSEPSIFQTKRRNFMLEVFLSIVGLACMPLVVMYNSWRARQWGWNHPFSVGVRRTELFKQQIDGVYKGFHHHVKGNTRAWLETLALPLGNTVHMLPHERSSFMRRQAQVLMLAANKGNDNSEWHLDGLITVVEAYEVEDQRDAAAHSAILRSLLNLSAHLGERYELSTRAIVLSLYWIANEMVEKQVVSVHKDTIATDLRVWVTL